MTAISVSRDCGMVHSNEKIALLEVQSDCQHFYNEMQAPRLNITIMGTATHPSEYSIVNLDNNNFDHIALEGKTWSVLKNHYAHLIPNILLRGTIFARFQPEQKTQLVISLQKLDYIVAMCGDGANDCGVSIQNVLHQQNTTNMSRLKIKLIQSFAEKHFKCQ